MPALLYALLLAIGIPAAGHALPVQAALDAAPPLDLFARFQPPGPPPGIDLPFLGSHAATGAPFETPVGPPEGVPPTPLVPAHGVFPLVSVPPHAVPPFCPVPEPGTALLVIGGLLGLAWGGRRSAPAEPRAS